MRAALTLILSGFLLLVGGMLLSRREPHPIEHPKDPPHRFPRSVRTPPTVGATFHSAGSPPLTTGYKPTDKSTRAPADSPLEQGIFWPPALEQALPMGFPLEAAERWKETARSAGVVALERGCGRSTNRMATLSDGSRVCVRYGINPEQIQGELLSYYLSRLLGLRGVPPCVLSRVGSPQWAPVQTELAATGWTQGALVSFTPWLHNLSSVLPPMALRAQDGKLRPLRTELGKGGATMLELAQWADLILFDYLTANFDRLVSNLFSLQWDPHIMLRGTNNLHRTPDGALVLLDNEAGFAHGYRLLGTWDKYNEQLLGTVCVFRRSVVRKVREMYLARNFAQELQALYLQEEPLAAELGLLSEAQAQTLQGRVGHEYKHMLSCQDKYS
ncbi:hypothetical protein XENTR_v10010679 [Xenopus tropicalis]|uniref:Four-jointed box kinase 1 n=1 Tax=Xenopus tropicalis TaxID=8364 RepID=A0A803JZC5_XENTR|nr:four-jointed box protein 1 [Xenopus tropicalis]KAE8606332.1 hypothetical protein XENTR_v10010679 [Xenopus tropicalis]|eukprot:XP_012817548.1 PREDICTED: four-jointed box protein 1 [Xenopus tropicalis]